MIATTAQWTKTNTKGNLLKISFEDRYIEFSVDGERQMFCGHIHLMFNASTNPHVWALAETKYAITSADKKAIEQIACAHFETFRKVLLEESAIGQAEKKVQIAKIPGLDGAIAKYGTYDKAHAAEDVYAADLLMQWEA